MSLHETARLIARRSHMHQKETPAFAGVSNITRDDYFVSLCMMFFLQCLQNFFNSKRFFRIFLFLLEW